MTASTDSSVPSPTAIEKPQSASIPTVGARYSKLEFTWRAEGPQGAQQAQAQAQVGRPCSVCPIPVVV